MGVLTEAVKVIRDNVFIKNTEYVNRPKTVNILWFIIESNMPEKLNKQLKYCTQ